MQKIELSDEDADHIRAWQRLTSDEKEALNKVAKLLGDDSRRKSFYTLIEAQAKISELITTANHIGWLGRLFLKAGAVAGVLLAMASVWKLYFGGK